MSTPKENPKFALNTFVNNQTEVTLVVHSGDTRVVLFGKLSTVIVDKKYILNTNAVHGTAMHPVGSATFYAENVLKVTTTREIYI